MTIMMMAIMKRKMIIRIMIIITNDNQYNDN